MDEKIHQRPFHEQININSIWKYVFPCLNFNNSKSLYTEIIWHLPRWNYWGSNLTEDCYNSLCSEKKNNDYEALKHGHRKTFLLNQIIIIHFFKNHKKSAKNLILRKFSEFIW